MYNAACVARLRRHSLSGKVQNFREDFFCSLKNLSTVSSYGIIAMETLVFVVLFLLYLTYSNRYITQGYVVNKLEAEKRQLTIKNEMANRLVEEAKALNNVRLYADGKMYSDAKTYFVEPVKNEVALKN